MEELLIKLWILCRDTQTAVSTKGLMTWKAAMHAANENMLKRWQSDDQTDDNPIYTRINVHRNCAN